MRVLVAGSLSYDYIMVFPGRFADRIMPDKIHKISLSFLADRLDKQFGGTAGNIAYNFKLLGIEPTVMATAGNDFAPYLRFLRKNKISASAISIYKNSTTSCYFVITDKEDNQIGSFYVGAQKFASKLSIKRIAQSRLISHTPLAASEFPLAVIAPTDPIAMTKFVKECRQLGLPYFYDPAFQIATFSPAQLKEGIEGAKILIANDYEMALIEDRLDISHEELIALVPVVITTLGSKGALIETHRDSIYVKPAKPKAVIDPTGAGDAFRAGFLTGYLHGFDLQICGQMGSTAAVYTVEKYGTVTHSFTKKDFIKRYKENFGETLQL